MYKMKAPLPFSSPTSGTKPERCVCARAHVLAKWHSYVGFAFFTISSIPAISLSPTFHSLNGLTEFHCIDVPYFIHSSLDIYSIQIFRVDIFIALCIYQTFTRKWIAGIRMVRFKDKHIFTFALYFQTALQIKNEMYFIVLIGLLLKLATITCFLPHLLGIMNCAEVHNS